MNVSSAEIEQMAKLRQIMEGNLGDSTITHISTPTTALDKQNEIADPTGGRAMKVILERFYQGINSCAAGAVESGDKVLTEALSTNPTPSGVQIGEWEISTEVTDGVKSFTVSNSSLVVASGVALYETALAVCRMLNTGVSITNPSMLEVLNLEAEYVKHRGEAVEFKRKAMIRRNSGDYDTADIAEARYSQARSAALQVRDKIISKSKMR